MTQYQNGLFIFRRDLRIQDNNTLGLMSKQCKNIYTIFIFTPEQTTDKNKYKSNNCLQFMFGSLHDLNKNLNQYGGKLHYFYGSNEEIIKNIINQINIDLVGFNMDVTPYSIKRDKKIITLCKKHKINIIAENDYYLHKMGVVKTNSGTPYQKYTPYYNTAVKIPFDNIINIKPSIIPFTNANLSHTVSIDYIQQQLLPKLNPSILFNGGRQEGLKVLKNTISQQKNYANTRNDLSKTTSRLSAHIKFGCLSIREVYNAMKSNTEFIKQLYWRDFYANILFHFPKVYGHAMKTQYDKIKWNNNKKWFDAWCNGITGFPIVDAGMRELNTTGFCHNRSRMIVMSFLIKTMLIDWKKGEQYFATKLIDYDPASNNGNIQWVAGSGADSQMYNRIFNPWTQGMNYDTNCDYIKKWIPELKNIPNKDIHHWNVEYLKYNSKINYPKPILDYSSQRNKTLETYKNAIFS